MKPERWRRIRELFERAGELAGPEREEFLEEQCGADTELRNEVEALLGHDAQAPADFATPPDFAELAGTTASIQEGQRLGDFQLLEELGRGAMGVVYRARQESAGRDVAVKVVGKGLFSNEDDLVRFQREARAAGRLDHPGIARVLVVGEEADLSWFAMELVPGHSLAEELRRQRPPNTAGSTGFLPGPGAADHAQVIARLIADAADALEHAHSQGIVHRDVKPSNLLLTPQGRLKLVDFGVAKDASFGTLTRSDQIVGSVPYMSPEQARILKSNVDQRTDVYSLGVVLYEALTGRRPFEGDTTLEVLTKIRTSQPRPVRVLNDRVPRDLAVICAKAMSKEPEERYTTAGALRDDLHRFLRYEAIEARPPGLALRARRFFLRRRALAFSVLAVVLALPVGWSIRAWFFPAVAPARLSVRGEADRQVWMRVLDPLSGQPGDPVSLGSTPLEGIAIEPAYVRILVERPQTIPRAFTRQLRAGVETVVALDGPLAADSRSGVNMILVGGGTLRVDEEPRESPLDKLELPIEPFWMDEAEVSIGQFREFLLAHPEHEAAAEFALFEEGAATDDLPVVNVSWEEARAYAEWRGCRLPTHAEWMWAARGEELRDFPWPDFEEIAYGIETMLSPPDALRYAGRLWPSGWWGATDRLWLPEGSAEQKHQQFLASVEPVRGSPYARSRSGLYHLLGNITEWTETAMYLKFTDPPTEMPNRRILCGGFWDCKRRERTLRYFEHWGLGPGERTWTRGFRCVRDAR